MCRVQVSRPELVAEQYDATDSEDEAPQEPKLQRYKKGDFELDDSGRSVPSHTLYY